MNSRASDPDQNRPATTDELLAHAGWVRTLSRALLSDPNEADDVVQDAWVAALKHPPTAGDGLRSWWARVVHSSASNRRRSEVRRGQRERVVASERVEASGVEVDSTLEAHRRLVDAVESLEEPLRRVIIEHYFHGASSRAIAEREGVADSTIRTRLQKALERLRRELDLRAGGDREAWAGLLAPLAGLEKGTPAAALGVFTLSSLLRLAAGLALVGIAGLTAYEVLDRSDTTSAQLPAAPVIAASESSTQVLVATPTAPQRTESAAPSFAETPAATPVEPVARVDARILDAHGLPIRGARMKLTDRSAIRECADADAPQAESDGAGVVAISIRDADRSRRRGKRGGLPRDTWDAEIEVTGNGYARRTLSATLVLGRPTSIGEVVLQDGTELSGRCLASDGSPLVRARVALMYPDVSLDEQAQARRGEFGRTEHLFSVACAADGSFAMPGVPTGCFRVYATAEKRAAAISEPFRLSLGEQHSVPDLVLGESVGAIRGSVLALDGSPCAEAQIEYNFDAGGHFVGTRAEKDGSFVLEGCSTAEVDIYARSSDGTSGEALLRGVRPGESGLVLKLPSPRRFGVHVEDPSGAPVERFSLSLLCEDGTGRGLSVGAASDAQALVARARPFLVRVLAGGFAPVEQGPFTQENMPAALEFRLPRSAMVRGRVVRDGVPEQSLEVRLDTRLEDPRVRGDGMPQLVEAGTRTATAKDGSFAIGAGRGGRFVLCVQGRQGALVLAQPLELELERPVEDLVVDLAAAGTIEGRVESTLATRARAAQILYSCGFGEPRCERIAPDGSYRLEGLAPGRWWLRVLPDTSSYSALLPPGTLIDDPQLRALDVTAGATMRCDFDVRGPETHCIEGRARLDDRAPAGWIATLARVERSWDAHRCADPLSAEGRFRLHAANFGTQILALRSPGTLLRDDIVEAHVNVPADGLQWSFECVLGALDLEGQPDAEFEFHADLPNGVAWTTHGKLDSTGRAALDSLPAVKAQLRSATGKASALEIEIPAQGRTHARLP